MRGSPVIVLSVVALLVVVAAPVRATTVLPLSLDDLVERSDVVAHVRVANVRIVERDHVPFRITELVVQEAFQGAQQGEVLELWQRGDGYLFVIGDPWLEPGQEGLAFFRRVDGQIYLTALAQSFWWLDGQGQEVMARRDLRGLAILPLGAPRVMPPDNLRWALLRQMILDACLGVHP